MVWRCCVPNCPSGYGNKKTEKDVTAHLFPRDSILKAKWIVAISREEESGILWSPDVWSKVCSKHFKKSDFSVSTKNKILLPQVVPSVFSGRTKRKIKNSKARNISENMSLDSDSEFSEHFTQVNCNLEFPMIAESSVKTASIGVQVSRDEYKLDNIPLEENSGSVSVPETVSVGVQVHSLKGLIKEKNCNCIETRKELYELRRRIVKLKTRIKYLKEENKEKKSSLETKMAKIKEDGKFGISKALFLLEQIKNYERLVQAYPI